MKIECLEKKTTKRVYMLLLNAHNFGEERALTFMKNALVSGREITIELPDDEEYSFRIACSQMTDD